jgi:hypothetical protein
MVHIFKSARIYNIYGHIKNLHGYIKLCTVKIIQRAYHYTRSYVKPMSMGRGYAPARPPFQFNTIGSNFKYIIF